MKYVITGSLGHISKPVTESLVKAGHSVTVITSQASKAADIQAIGATAAVGSVEDPAFLRSTFAGADAVYLMIPPKHNPAGTWLEHLRKVADNYVDAVIAAKINRVVVLSSIGAHMGSGAGPVDGLSYLEWKLNQHKSLHVRILRPAYFFYNLLGQINFLKGMNIFGANYGQSGDKLVLVHTDDIAEVVSAELLGLKFKGHTIRYIASDERSAKEIAAILGKAVGKPDAPWVEFKDADALGGMLQAGLPKTIAEAYVQMGKAVREGTMAADYWKNRPTLGKRKLEAFAREFAQAYAAS